MELLEKTIIKLNINTADIKSKDIQEVLMVIRKNSQNSYHFNEHYNQILEKLWMHLSVELEEYEDQLLCSTCFFTVLNKSNNQDIYLDNVFAIIQHELERKGNVLDDSKISLAVSLCYGLFQSTYLLQKSKNFNITIRKTIDATFHLLLQKAYEYTQYTFIVFKIMTSFKKVIGSEFQDTLLNTDNQIKLLNMINHNWENPITGIRNLNRIVFQNLLLVLNKNIYEIIIDEINCFCWNKAKFLMLAEIVENYKGKIDELIIKNQWLDGLLYSLSKPGLVSAGADMYSAVLKKVSSDENWIAMFLDKVLKILHGACFKTIENFTNYWCLNTLKKFPSLLELLTNQLSNTSSSEYTLYSTVCILKQGSKIGLSKKILQNCNDFKNKETLISFSLEHCNTSVRMMAFEIICISQQNFLPTNVEFKQILKYLSDNVNSDCTVLRISMINNLTIFLDKLHILYQNSALRDDERDIHNLINFCQNLQIFVVESINLNGNYQRKITSVKIAQVVLKSFIGLKPQRKQKQSRATSTSLVKYLKEQGLWKLNENNFIMKLLDLLKDPANDVHEGVLQILSEFYTIELSDKFLINYLIEEGLKSIASKFFYEIHCGQIMFKLVINILLKNNTIESKFNNIESIFNFAFNEITTEYKQDIVKSIQDGKQLHSFINILSIIFDILIKNSLEIRIKKDAVISLLNIVDHISTQFIWEENSSTSSDFSKMSDMVQTLIQKSGLDLNIDNDHTRISDVHQIVLNCLWLNVKASCDLASLLIQYYKYDEEICEKSLNIITRVLETSRHKGAIEAAGTALGAAIQSITCQEDNINTSKLALILLKTKLSELLFETSKMASVTRRGAGLSIMIHRIVSNDLKKGKPLFHYFMKTLLNTCKSFDDIKSNEEIGEIDNEKDLPKAIHIHFLTRIVIDSSLASDMMYYSVELAELAFDNLINHHWQIRNAALQLYGALIPKLIGQKKASGMDDETIATVACDEFRSHNSKLWEYIVKQIKYQNYEDIIQAHSNLVPILNVLASLAKRYNFSYDLKDQKNFDLHLLSNLLPLLGSPIYTVRRLTSQCIPNIYSFNEISHILENVQISQENYLHGILMLISNFYKNFSHTDSVKLDQLSSKYCDIIKLNKTSYMSKWTLHKFCKDSENITIEMIKNVKLELQCNRYEPGVSLWAQSKIQNYLENIPWNEVPEALCLVLSTDEFEIYCNTFIKRIEKNIKRIEDESQPPEKVLSEIVELLLSSNMILNSSTLWKLLFTISLRIDINVPLCAISVINEHTQCPLHKLRYIIPFATRVLVKQRDHKSILLLSKSIYLLCNPETYDTDMRYISALANNEFGTELESYSDDVKINAIKTAVLLLQDEDEDIRLLSVNFYSNYKNVSKHPYICLKEILKHDFLCKVFNEPQSNVQIFCSDLLCLMESTCVNKNNEYNPFSNDSKNIYLEKNWLKQILTGLSQMCF